MLCHAVGASHFESLESLHFIENLRDGRRDGGGIAPAVGDDARAEGAASSAWRMAISHRIMRTRKTTVAGSRAQSKPASPNLASDVTTA